MTHAFVSYVRENGATVQRLVDDLRRCGIEVWNDRESIAPGCLWEDAIRRAIAGGAYFLACFSAEYQDRQTTYMDEELTIATALLARQELERAWLIPVLLNPCEVPDRPIDAHHTLRSLQHVDLSRDWQEGLRRLLGILQPGAAVGRLRHLRAPPRDSTAIEADSNAPWLALDFGTTYSSAVAFGDDLALRPIRDPDGRALVPSVVAFREDWDYYVGWEAEAVASQAPERVVRNVKRRLGTDERIAIGHKELSPETVAGLVVRYLKDCAERTLGVRVSDALVAMPANFSFAQSEALVRVCQGAGLRVRRLIGEPSAAGLMAVEWYRARKRAGRSFSANPCVLVVDVGGGTTDVAVVVVAEVDDEMQVEVIAIAGDNELGGIDYDAALCRYLRDREIEPRVAAGLCWSARDELRLAQAAAEAKLALSASDGTVVSLGEVEDGAGGLVPLRFPVTRAALRRAVEPLDARIRSVVARAIERSGVNDDDYRVEAILLAGQGSKLPTILDVLEGLLPGLPIVKDYQEKAVVSGLGTYSGVLTFKKKDLLLLDVTHRPIVVRCVRAPAEEGCDLLVSCRREGNGAEFVVLAACTLIPNRMLWTVRVEGSGTVALEFREGDPGALRESVELATVPVEGVAHGDELRLRVEVDENKTIDIWVRGPGGETLASRQITNLFMDSRSRRSGSGAARP